MTRLVCVYCGKVRQGGEKQPKQLAKIYGWKHGKARGSWVCPECQKFMPVQPK
jgi:hypothetical protein